MRAATILMGALATLAGCASDPCSGISGGCVALTVTSRAVISVDTFDFTATGAISRHVISPAGHATNLPVHLALAFAGSTSGMIKLDVVGQRGGQSLAVGTTSLTLAAGKHVSATVDIEPINGGGPIDLAFVDVDGGGGSGGTGGGGGTGGSGGGGGDMMTPNCDPNGVTGPACVWRYQNPYPTAEDVIVVRKVSDTKMYALTSLGLLLRRDAMGWKPNPTPPPAAFIASALAVTSSGDIYLGGRNLVGGLFSATIYHSTDDAVTWTQETLPASALGQSINALSAQGSNVVGAATAGWILFRASDGSWSAQQKGTIDFHAAFFNSVLGAFVAGNNGTIWSGGTSTTAPTWVQVATTGTTAQLNGLCGGKSAGGARLWAVGYLNTVVSALAANAATTWAVQTNGTGSNNAFVDCVAGDDMSAWLVGDSGSGGVYLATTNGGATWAGGGVGMPGADVSQRLMSIDVANGSLLVVSGRGGLIQTSPNGGNSFVEDSKGKAEAFRGIAAVAPGIIYAVGGNAAIYRTTNSGATWSRIDVTFSGTAPDFNEVWGSSATDVYVVGTLGWIMHSSDGTTFTKYAGAQIPATASLTGVSGAPGTGVFAVGFDTGAFTYQVFRSADHGMTWTAATVSGGGKTLAVPMSQTPRLGVFGLSAGLWIGGNAEQMFFTADGTTWTPQTTSNSTGIPADYFYIRGREPHELFALTHTSNQALLVRSTDGLTWTVLPATTLHDQQLFLAVTPSGDEVWTSASDGLELSTDHGMTWTHPTTNVLDPIQSGDALYAPAANDVYYLSETGGIAHYGN